MKTIISCLILLLQFYYSFAQKDINKITDSITTEGKLLYRSEMASWYGTDIFLEQHKDRATIGGYFSYLDGKIAKCIFYSKEETPKVIGTISFDSTYNVSAAATDLGERAFTATEQALFKIRSITSKLIRKDTLFKTYANTSLNLIPLISNNEKKVYILTGPEKNGVVIFGNDYLVSFDENDNIKNKKELHRNIITVDYGSKVDGIDTVVGAAHTHLAGTSDFLTATDICTLMLYSRFAGWKQHTVVSENYFSFWNCETNEFTALTKDVMDKIYGDQKKRKNKN